MKLLTTLTTVLTGCGLALASGAAMAVPCSTITTIGQWEAAGSCDQGDKVWTIGANTLDASVQVLFSSPLESIHVMQLVGFDNSNLAGAWSIDYSISVIDPNFVISAMFAGADSPGGGSMLTKDVTGDEVFGLSVVNGVEGPLSERLGLSATTLNISEDFSVNAGANLLSVSNTYRQTEIPEPGSLALIGLALAGLAVVRRRRC
jgi:PEP-CTERM motif